MRLRNYVSLSGSDSPGAGHLGCVLVIISRMARWPGIAVPSWLRGTATGKVPFRVVILFIEH